MHAAVVPVVGFPVAALGSRSGFWVVLVVGGIIALGVEAGRRQRQRAIVASLGRFVDRHPGWHRQAWPAGISLDLLVGRFAATPCGDRRLGVELAVDGPLDLDLDLGGGPVTCQVACFAWFHERTRRRRSRYGSTATSYERRSDLVVLCQLPVRTHRGIKVLPGSLLGRVGLTREGTHRDRSLDGPVQTYPAILQDLARLLRHLPLAFWRQLGLDPDRAETRDDSPPQER